VCLKKKQAALLLAGIEGRNDVALTRVSQGREQHIFKELATVKIIDS
jgi:hypothetical protein